MAYRRTLTTELVIDYIDHRLRKAGYGNWADGIQLIANRSEPGGIHLCLRIMGDEFRTAYFNAFQDMIGSINIHGEDLKEIIYKVFDVTCETGIEWGRITGFFVFASMLAVKAMDCNRRDVVEEIIQCTADYLEDQKYSNWINQHNGWEGYAKFYNLPKRQQDDQDTNQSSISKAYNVGAQVFTGFATFANFLMHS